MGRYLRDGGTLRLFVLCDYPIFGRLYFSRGGQVVKDLKLFCQQAGVLALALIIASLLS